MIAELFQGSHLSLHGNLLSEYLDFLRAVLDVESSRAGRLKSDEQDEVSRVRQALDQVMQYASAGCHAARRNDDCRVLRLIDLLGIVGREIEVEIGPV